MTRLYLAATAAVFLAAPAATQQTPPPAESGTPVPATRQRRDADLITLDEIRTRSVSNVFELVRALRPRWLQGRRGASTIDTPEGEVVVYDGATRAGGPEFLRTLIPNQVASLRYYNPSDAQRRFGRDHSFGAIVITRI